MAMKEIVSKRRTVTFELGTEKVTMTLRRYEGKVRQRDPITFKNLGWGMSGYTCVKCDHFPNADWRPYIDFGTKTTDCSLSGWEAKTPEWEAIDRLATSLIFEYKGWTDDEGYEPIETVLADIKKISDKLLAENGKAELKACGDLLKEING